jgi:hypothetical protein
MHAHRFSLSFFGLVAFHFSPFSNYIAASGMSKEQWKQLKEKEKNNSKNLGKVGITKFQSRTLSDWQKAGGKNLFPVDPKSVKSKKDLPYVSYFIFFRTSNQRSLPLPNTF